MNLDNNSMKYIGWNNTIQGNDNYSFIWDRNRLLIIQQKITQLLEGVGPSGRSIIVPLDKIAHVLNQVYNSNNPQVGDIYSRYTLPSLSINRDDITEIVDRTINIIVTSIRNEYEMIKCNNKLSIWDSVYGDFNRHGLRAHPPIKVRKRRSERMQFHMNY